MKMLTDGFADHARGVTVAMAAALGVDQSLGVLAQAVPEMDNNFLMQLAEKGGGWAVLLVVLFFYRRDYQRLTNSESEFRKEQLAAASRQADSELKLATALTQNTEVIRSYVAQKNGKHYDEERAR